MVPCRQTGITLHQAHPGLLGREYQDTDTCSNTLLFKAKIALNIKHNCLKIALNIKHNTSAARSSFSQSYFNSMQSPILTITLQIVMLNTTPSVFSFHKKLNLTPCLTVTFQTLQKTPNYY